MDPIAQIANMIRDAEKHADDQSQDRVRAVEYYMGEMRDTPADDGRSKMVSRDVRAQIKKVLPSIKRTILGSDIIGEYMPVGPGDEGAADQATDYVNRVISPEVDLHRKVEDAIHDALSVRNGILHWEWQEKQCTKTSSHTGLNEFAFAELASDPEVEVLENTEYEEVLEVDGRKIAVTMHDCKVKRTYMDGKVQVNCVPRERFLIHPEAVDLQTSILTGQRMRMTRSDLVAMGYDYDMVMGLTITNEEDYESDIRRDHVNDNQNETHRPNEEIDYYDVYVRFDMDEDGIAELRHMCFGGALHQRNLLHDEECGEVQYADLKVMRQPHQWEGISLADDLMDIQRAKTVLLRNTLDNIYWMNNPQPTYQDGVVENPEALFNPEFGLPVRVRQGVNARDAVSFLQVPFVAKDSYAMLDYMDQEAQDRTGVSDASAGLAPDALQNMTATAANLAQQAAIGQTELMVNTVAEGLRDLFRGLLKLIIRHQDMPRTVRLRDEWVEFDPRHWNADMDATINVGLGAGTRERDMQVMQFVIAMQEKLLTAFGPDNPYVKPDDVWEALSRMIEAAGLKTPDLYFTEPDPDEVAAKMQQAAEAAAAPARAEQAKMQMEMQLKQADMQAKMQLEREKAATQTQKEAAQLEADMAIEDKRLAADMAKLERELQWEREKHLSDQRLKLTEMGLEQGEGGVPINRAAEDMRAVYAQTQEMLAALSQQMAAANTPKRIVRDEMGEIIGVEPVQLN